MASLLTWIDHDPAARDRALRILSLFRERDSRDELGLGAVRDSFSDALFPGTSTIQTRLRYMLFVPWVYCELEKKRVPAEKFAARARQLEMAMVAPLLASDDNAGVFGKMAGGALKRLPSAVYWSGLGAWGIRLINCSQEEYHRGIEEIYRRRERARAAAEHGDVPHRHDHTWHPRLPAPPDGFPGGMERLGFDLRQDEAGFLLDRSVKSQPDSLLTHMALNCSPAECAFPWQHPERAGFRAEHRELLDCAEFFSTIMQGAAFLYNLMLAELAGKRDIVETHRENLAAWQKALASTAVRDLPTERLWEKVSGSTHRITRSTKEFVSEWVERTRATGGKVADDGHCRRLVEQRERRLKGERSRFSNHRARDQWKGFAGAGQMAFRWPNAKVLLDDLYDGLKGSGHARS